MKPFTEILESRALFASYTASTVTQLINAINSANSSAAADTITLAAGATFTLNAVNNETNGSTGLPRIVDRGGLTIFGNGATLDTTIACRFFDVASGASLTLNNLTIQNGLATSRLAGDGTFTYLPAQGGAIYNEGALTLNGVTIQNSSAQGAGGGFWGTPTVADAAGGGIYSIGTLALSGCTIRNNAALGGYGQNGGFIYADMGGYYYPGGDGGSAFGGGICSLGGAVDIANTTFTANLASGGDGGNGYDLGTSRYGGDGGDALGGGVYAGSGSLSMRNCSASQNIARAGTAGLGVGSKKYNGVAGKGIGGGIYRASGASLLLDDYTIAHVVDNTATTSSPNIAGSSKRLR